MTERPAASPEDLALKLGRDFGALPHVQAVALSGSVTAGVGDGRSDIDLYVYSVAPVEMIDRRRIALAGAGRAELGNEFWEPGDEWIDRESGIAVDVMFRSCSWIEAQMERTLVRHEAWIGYTTCFWHNVRASSAVFDRDGWFAGLQRRAAVEYPEPLRRAIVAKNHPILRSTISSYRHQIELALARRDAVSVHHRCTAVLASVFDILFAINRVPHPGEKRLLAYTASLCPKRPAGFDVDVRALLATAGACDGSVLEALDRVLDGLDALLTVEELLPRRGE